MEYTPYPRHGKPVTAQTQASGLTSGSVLHMTPSKSIINTSDGTAANLALPGLGPSRLALHGLPRHRCLESCGNRSAW